MSPRNRKERKAGGKGMEKCLLSKGWNCGGEDEMYVRVFNEAKEMESPAS